MIRARMRADARWDDACILNISSRGIGVRAASPPPHGTYVEIARGHHVIIARVIWVDGQRFGALSQDRLAVDAIAAGTNPPSPPECPDGARVVERRSARRLKADLAQRHDRSRHKARSMQFVWFAGFGAVLAVMAYSAVERTLARQLAVVSSELS